LAGLLVGRSLSAPLLGLADAAERMGSGDLATRAPAAGSAETALLAREFNRMAERLESSFGELAAERDALRRFIGDASHELRTPITALKTFNELLSEGAAEDRAARDEFLAESARQLARLERITHGLLDLSRLDGGVAALDVRAEPVTELLEDAACAYKRIAEERKVQLSLATCGPDLTVTCDRRRVESALSNLVDNALKHTPAGGTVELGAHNGHGAVTFWVCDTGDGIDAVDAPHVFERFYRGKNAASGDGAGLGLAIVRSVAQAHGGSAALESAPGQGTRFTITLPLVPS
jgi:two-component system, OmpR family, sensor histidine kinase BaeS